MKLFSSRSDSGCYCWITSSICIHHISQITEFIYLFQRYPITSIQMQISIKPICDWPIYLTTSADESLACITQTSFHSTTSFMNPFLATMAQSWIIAHSHLSYTIGPQSGHLPFSSILSFVLQLNITFVFPVFIFKPFASNPDFHFTILPAIKKDQVICIQLFQRQTQYPEKFILL